MLETVIELAIALPLTAWWMARSARQSERRQFQNMVDEIGLERATEIRRMCSSH